MNDNGEKHVIKKSALANVLSSLGFSLRANKKNIEGVPPERDLQFHHIATTCAAFEKKISPIISVDCKKKELQQLSNETRLAITVTYLPPATSKWNKIEHRLFSYISINWRARPLISLETIIELLSSTFDRTQGLTVTATLDKNIYPMGVKVSDSEMNQLNITRNEFHGDWNYTFRPQLL